MSGWLVLHRENEVGSSHHMDNLAYTEGEGKLNNIEFKSELHIKSDDIF